MRSLRPWLVVLAATPLACGSKDARTASVTTPPANVSAQAAPPARPSASASLAQRPEAKSPFGVVARAGASVSSPAPAFYALEDKLFLVAGPAFYEVAGGTLTRVPAMSSGIPMREGGGEMPPEIHAFGGRMPDAAFLVLSTNRVAGRIAIADDAYRFSPRGFVKGPHLGRFADGKLGVAIELHSFTTAGGAVIAAAGLVLPYGADPALLAAAGRKQLVVLAGTATLPKIPPGFCVSDVAGFPTGDLFVLGTLCGSAVDAGSPAPTAAGFFAPKGGAPLPVAVLGAASGGSVHAIAPNDIYVPLEDKVSHFDGASWTSTPLPSAEGHPEAYDAAKNGTEWVAVGGALYRRARGGTWETVSFPEKMRIQQIVARADDDVWVVAQGDESSVVVHTGSTAATPLALPTYVEIAAEAADRDPPAPVPTGCQPGAYVMTLLQPLPDAAAPRYAYDELRAAVRTKAAGPVDLLEVRWRGKRYVALESRMRDDLVVFDKATIAKLGGPGAPSYCAFHPTRLRAFTISATGELADKAD